MASMHRMQATVRRSKSGLALAVGAALGAVSMPGCDTLLQDVQALGDSIAPITPQQAARWMVDPHDPDHRRRGLVLVANSPFGGADVYVAWYRDVVRAETDPLVKAAALTALGRYGQPQDAPLIARALEDEHRTTRWEAAKALQRVHNTAVVPDLLGILRKADEDSDIQVAVAHALGQYPQDRVFQGLVAALDAHRLSINLASQASLQTLTGEDHGLKPEAWLKWYGTVGDPFVGQQAYLYPTYQRQASFLERLAFWSGKRWEEPAPPVGLDVQRRRTYDHTDGSTSVPAPADS